MLQVISVYDSAVGAFMNPFYSPSTAAGIRAFHDEVQREGSPMGTHPGDYILFHLGTFDPETGEFDLFENRAQLIRAVDCLPGGKNAS